MSKRLDDLRKEREAQILKWKIRLFYSACAITGFVGGLYLPW